ncbi:receptor-like protein 2 [Rosa rugosa]|uniref:receptor-like protein 2 n=1 Tax=Rosa rugosa TaxID=74645 RepID=UPI002B409225|nr:receptor-like protein 2 [Rosa rugosa]
MLVQPHNTMAHGFLLFLIFIFSSNIYTKIQACNHTERSSLLSFAHSLSPPLNWTSSNCCHWKGITCNDHGLVTNLCLPSKGLKLKGGVFPSSSLGNLTYLTHLNLSHNSLYGLLDQTELFLPSNSLEILDFSYNLLFGELPFCLLSSIRILDLSSNHFRGEIPPSFFQQAWNLTSFNVRNNSFSGSIPSSICLHSPLIQLLDFSSNKFNGSISHGLGKCLKLQVFRAGHNDLSGFLPDDIYTVSTLQEVALPQNSLHGAISERLVNLTNLKVFDLTSNDLSGGLPASIGKLFKLQVMLLDFNNLEGSLPPSLMNCTNLIDLRMGDNNLAGDISLFDFSKLSQLTKLDLRKNNFSGTLPLSLYSCKLLKAIRLSENNLEGEIQPEILSLKSLSFLSVGTNRLTNITKALQILVHCRSLVFLSFKSSFIGEEMPADLGMVGTDGFENLRILALHNSELTGQIPVWVSTLKKLEVLFLSLNRITGSIPSWLGNLPRLYFIKLSSNLLSGEFPKDLCRLPMFISKLTAAQEDDTELELPLYLSQGATFLQYKLSYVPPAIYINNNTISGNIPIEIGQLQLLHELGLHNNKFSGKIPEQISNLKNLEVLDISTNHLSGKIPSSLASLNFLKYFNVSNNNLEGQIPISTQIQSFNASAFEGNPKLCGAPLPNECMPINGSDPDNKNIQDHVDNGHQIPQFNLSVAFGFIVGFLGVCGPLVLKKWRDAYFQFLDNVKERLCHCNSVNS